MKLSELSKKPQLVVMALDDEETVKEYGEPIEFYTWDRQPMDLFMKMGSLDSQNQGAIIDVVKDLIMDEKGNKLIEGENTLPGKILMRVMTKVVEGLGK